MNPVTSLTARAAPPADAGIAPGTPATGEPAIVLERVARGLRGARARTRLSETDVVAILARQGIALTALGLRRAESTGVIALGMASCLADIYGTTTDGLAGRRLHRKRPSLDDFPSDG
jgi:hypothetical protein